MSTLSTLFFAFGGLDNGVHFSENGSLPEVARDVARKTIENAGYYLEHTGIYECRKERVDEKGAI